MPVLIVVVLDSCDDGSDHLAERFGPNVHFISIDAGNVGAARAAGFEYARSVCTDVDPARTWFATTDADTIVGSQWLSQMTEAGADMVLGMVRISVWRLPRRGCPPLPGRVQLERTRGTITSTAPTWDSAQTRTGASEVSVRWAPVRTSSSSNDSSRRTCASTGTPSFRWRRRPAEEGRAPNGFAAHLRELRLGHDARFDAET